MKLKNILLIALAVTPSFSHSMLRRAAMVPVVRARMPILQGRRPLMTQNDIVLQNSFQRLNNEIDALNRQIDTNAIQIQNYEKPTYPHEPYANKEVLPRLKSEQITVLYMRNDHLRTLAAIATALERKNN